MNYRLIYDLYERHIDDVEETDLAEEKISSILKEVQQKDRELYFELDSAIGTLSRAYEKRGFNGGLKFMKEAAIF